LVGEKKKANKIILALVEKNFLSQFKDLLEEEEIDFSQPDTGLIITLPVSGTVGLRE